VLKRGGRLRPPQGGRNMRLRGGVPGLSLALAFSGWLCYVGLVLEHWYDTSVRVPQTQRIAREVKELRLPRLYFCPADRGRMEGFQWASYECKLAYKDQHNVCDARIQAFKGRTPEEFRGSVGERGKSGKREIGKGDGEAGEEPGGQCLEFSTEFVGVREEWSAAWNQVILRASFHVPSMEGISDALQEVELGYQPVEWERGSENVGFKKYYYPLLRVPFFFNSIGSYAQDPAVATPPPTPGVATRMYIAREIDKGLSMAGKFWYAYGAMQIAVVNSSTPQRSLADAPYGTLNRRLGVVHVVLTLEDFEEFDFKVVSGFFPFLGMLGQIAGMAAFMALWLFGSKRIPGESEDELELGSRKRHDSEYKRVDRPDDDDDGSGEEKQGLLSNTESRTTTQRSTKDRPGSGAGQALLLSTEEGADGL